RIYALPFLSQPLALSTQFEYDSWGRILNITYPDNEVVNYEYDLGGQLFKFYNNQNYIYLDSIQYNKFGAKTSQLYGNGIKTNYTYYPLTQRLDSLLTTYSGNTLSYLQYNYDSVGNIIRVNSSYPMPQYQVTERYTYDSADQLLTAESTCNNNVLCSGAYSYNNWGKINTYTQQTTDPATNTSENKDYRYYFPGSSADMAQGQTSFAPIIKYDMQQNPQPLETCTYGINGSIRKRYDHQTQNTDYYYFNVSGNLKACGTDMQISLYGYNASNTRTYKVNLFNANQWVNGQPQPIQPMVQSAMFYPNTYLNFTQAGEYTKHYYNGTERIASRLGEQQVPVSVENDQELLNYQHDTKEILRNAIGQHLYDEPTDMQEGEVLHLEYLQPCGNNNAIYYYHPNHLSSTMYVTDVQQSVVQSFLYAPYGEIISEYNTHAMGDAFPKYAFNAKELDEETGMYYYEARYYKPPVFTSRDPMFEKYFWMTPYAYCANNPVKYVDPSGEEISTHTDAEGNVVAVYNDGDNNVYRHNGDRNYTNSELKLLYSNSNTSAGGEKMGETEFWDEFISPETGNVMTNIRIQFGKSFMPIIQRMHEESLNMNLVEIAMESKGSGKFNIKNKYINVGALLNGKYATSRSAGNFLAGYNASTGSYKGVRIRFNKFQQLAGALHIQESSNNELTKSQMRQIVLYGSFTPSNLQDIYKFVPPTYGEVEYQYRMSKMGWIYGKR
ncbi:MAG: RHS repeat-associated core domain-containing protein, partial [Bacteroidales bacterium]|nr:RHS repeat-associated core domain-containing protein [Bacteroidales bacterium]